MDIIVKRPRVRKAIYVPLGQSRESPSVIIPTYGMDKREVEETVEALLEKRGLNAADRRKAREEAEVSYENRWNLAFAKEEINRRREGQLPRMKKKNGSWRRER